MSEIKRKYIDVNIKKEWEPYLKEALEQPEVQKALAKANRKMLPSSLGVWIIERWLIDNTSFRFEHFNTWEDHTTIIDKKLRNGYIDIFFKLIGDSKFDLWCEKCDSQECEHIDFALKEPKIMEKLKQKGLKYLKA